MGLNCKVGTFAQPTSSGNQSVSGLGFQPKIVLFFGTQSTSDASASDATVFFGVAVSSTDRRAITTSAADNVTSTQARYNNKNTACIVIATGTVTEAVVADLVSMNSDGFTLNFDTVDSRARIINYLALGGTDLTNYATGQDTIPTTATTKAVTVGFRPDCVLLFSGKTNTSASASAAANTAAFLGWFTSTTGRAYTGWRSRNARPSASTFHRQSASKAVAGISDTGVFAEADVSSIDTNGFTLNWTTVPGAAEFYYYVALKGPQFKVGSFNQATSTGTQATSGVGFQPAALLLASANATTSSATNTQQSTSLGMATSTSQRAGIWWGDNDGVSTTQADGDLDRTKAIILTNPGSTPTRVAAADLSSFDASGFTLNWTTVDATAREIIYLAIGAAATGAQTISPSAIASAEAFGGSAKLNRYLLPSAISSAQAFGTSKFNRSISGAGAIASQEASGSHTVQRGAVSVLPSGIASGEAFGASRIVLYAVPSAIVSAEAFGVAMLNMSIAAPAIASAESFGAPKLNLKITPAGIASLEAFGSAIVSAGTLMVQPITIASAESFGASQLNLRLIGMGIGSGEVFGTSKLNLRVALSAIASGEAFGNSQLNLRVLASGIVSAESFGSAIVNTGTLILQPAGIGTGEVFGAAVLSARAYILPVGITGAEAFGTSRLNLKVLADAIASAESFGAARLNLALLASAIASAESFGTGVIQPGAVVIGPTGIVSAEVVGVASIRRILNAIGIASAEAFGSIQILSVGSNPARAVLINFNAANSSLINMLVTGTIQTNIAVAEVTVSNE
jgi:hypothetical protein